MQDLDFYELLYLLAERVNYPLIISGISFALFFMLAKFLLKNINLKSVAPEGVFKLALAVISYGFLLSLVSLVLGVFSWLYVEVMEPAVVRTTLKTHLEKNEFKNVVEIAEPYLEKKPMDHEARKFLGTSYFATNQYVKGLHLFTEMNNILKTSEVCNKDRLSAIFAIVAFNAMLKNYEEALVFSNSIASCDGFTEEAAYNHVKITSMLGKQKELTPPNGFSFSSSPSYFQAIYSLLQYLHTIRLGGDKINDEVNFKYIVEAYCEDDLIRKFIELRFNDGDANGINDLIHQNFDYETKIIKEGFTKKERKTILDKITQRTCLL